MEHKTYWKQRSNIGYNYQAERYGKHKHKHAYVVADHVECSALVVDTAADVAVLECVIRPHAKQWHRCEK